MYRNAKLWSLLWPHPILIEGKTICINLNLHLGCFHVNEKYGPVVLFNFFVHVYIFPRYSLITQGAHILPPASSQAKCPILIYSNLPLGRIHLLSEIIYMYQISVEYLHPLQRKKYEKLKAKWQTDGRTDGPKAN
jgi:hypothetical protein